MPFLSLRTLAIGVLAALSGLTTAADPSDKTSHVPCTIRSPNSGAFYDLHSLSRVLSDPDKKSKAGAATESWQARGWDFNANFSMNFCAPVIEELKDVQGISEAQWQNVSAFYKKGGKTYSIG
jgi:cation-dependent mannose-6-phosphate receptor